MGLDSYGEATDAKFGTRTELAYWRKFSPIHEWMKRLYIEKGGTDEFNCKHVELSRQDVERLRSDFVNFEWYTGEQFVETAKFIAAAIDRIEAGETVRFTSWY
jgi:hypothetical protein